MEIEKYGYPYNSIIGVGRFRILGGGQGLEILGGGPKGGQKSQQAHDVVMTSMRRNDVASMSFRRHVSNRFLINQCQIITFLILKYDIIENSRTELRGIVLPVQVMHYWGGGGGGGGGGQRVCWPPPPLKLLGGACPPPPPPPPLFLRLCRCFKGHFILANLGSTDEAVYTDQ